MSSAGGELDVNLPSFIITFYLFLSPGLILQARGRQGKKELFVCMTTIIKNLVSSEKEISRRLRRRVKWGLTLGRVVRAASEGAHFWEGLRRQN